MSFDPVNIQEYFSKGGGATIALHTPFAYYAKHLSGLATGCLSFALMSRLVGVDLASIALAQRAILAADLSIKRKSDSNYIVHWTESSCYFCMAIADWIISSRIDMQSLDAATIELDALYAGPRRILHKSDLEWGLYAYLFSGNIDKYVGFGKKYNLKPFVKSIGSDYAFGGALIQYTETPSENILEKLASYVNKKTVYFIDSGCYYHAMMLTVLLGFVKDKAIMPIMDAVLQVYDIIGKQYPGKASFKPDPELIEFAKNR